MYLVYKDYAEQGMYACTMVMAENHFAWPASSAYCLALCDPQTATPTLANTGDVAALDTHVESTINCQKIGAADPDLLQQHCAILAAGYAT